MLGSLQIMPDAALPIGYKWGEISDLPADLDAYRDRELETLCQVWTDEKERIGEQIQSFGVQLAREWAIETGIIEGVYTLDRGITQTLIEHGIDSSYIPHDATNIDPELAARIMQAHQEVLEGLFAFVKGERPLSTSYIKELHAALLRHSETVVVFDALGRAFETRLEKGAYKTLPNNPKRPDGAIHEYCPPEHVASEMDRLIELHRQHELRGVQPQIEAAWLHHAFTQIHPFQDGNGRVARALASLVFIKAGYFPLVITRDDRAKYIDALELADSGDLAVLIQLFARIQKRALTRAISRAVDVKPVQTLEDAVAAARDLLVGPGKIIPTEYLAAKATAGVLAANTGTTLAGVAERLTTEISSVDSKFTFQIGQLGGPPENELHALKDKLHYGPNVKDFHDARVLTMKVGSAKSMLVVSFHGVGIAFRGLLASVGYFQAGENPPVPLSEDVFLISYKEPQGEALPRFMNWLDSVLIRGLAEWRRTLV